MSALVGPTDVCCLLGAALQLSSVQDRGNANLQVFRSAAICVVSCQSAASSAHLGIVVLCPAGDYLIPLRMLDPDGEQPCFTLTIVPGKPSAESIAEDGA